MSWLLIFTLVTFLLFLLPLSPALLELAFASDTMPLAVVQQYDGDITYFARSFKVWLSERFPAVVSGAALKGMQQGDLGKAGYQLLGGDAAPVFSRDELKNGVTNRLIVSAAPLAFVQKMRFGGEVYCKASVNAFAGSQFRALLADGDILFAKGCTVVRWVHSEAELKASENCALFGRASAAGIMTLAKGCQFQRLNAPQIVFGEVTDEAWQANLGLLLLESSPEIAGEKTLWRAKEALDIPANSAFDGDIACSGAVKVGGGSHIIGSIKSNADMHIADNVRIEGAVVSTGSLHIGRNCKIDGPVIAQGTVHVARGTVIGSEKITATLTAPRVNVAMGVVVYGSIWTDNGTAGAA